MAKYKDEYGDPQNDYYEQTTQEFQPFNHGSKNTPEAQPVMKKVEKFVAAGKLAGFSVQNMIDMLNGGLSVGDLLDVIAYCLHDKRKPHA